MGLFSLAILVLLLLVFLRAALHKVFDFLELQGLIEDYQILPTPLIQPAALMLVLLELTVVALALPTATRGIALGLATVLLTVYSIAIAINIQRGRTQIECGCGGAPQMLGLNLLVRNTLLLALILVPLLWPPIPVGAAATTLALLAGGFLWLMYQFFEQAGVNQQAYKTAQAHRSNL